MNSQQPPPGISSAEWAATPASVRSLVKSLLTTVEQLQQRVAELEERLNQNSGNSSKPPSSDPPQARKYSQAEPSGRRRGGQKGHVGQGRKLKGPEQVQRVVISRPTACQACGALLLGEDPHPSRHQVTELPRVEPVVVEYQTHTLTCLACGAATSGEWPAEMPRGSFGERLQATTAYLTGRFGVSQRDVAEMLASLFHVELGLGSVPAQQQRVSRALAPPTTEAQAFLAQQPAVNVDETSWSEANQTIWLWTGSTPQVTVFSLNRSRGADGAKSLVGHDYAGIVGSDRWQGYNWLDERQRQLCWAHLKRDFQALVERGGGSAIVGQLLLVQVEHLFTFWHQFRDSRLSRSAFQEAMRPVRHEIETLLQLATLAAEHPKTRKTCQNILKFKSALWTFVDQEGVAPTNNAAERALRRGVLWRSRSFGTQSEAGSRFVERILTAVTTLRQQHRDVLDFLTQACQALTCATTPPSLVPDG